MSTCTLESPIQVAPIEELGYRVTCFSDSNQLLESLRSGKPNLLICDPVTLGDAAYDLCRTLKADRDLWVIPVLIAAGASDLSDLLHVLDCNADNFIATPYDTTYLAAIIEGLLSTPVERQTPDQIKTQFKIQHDEQLYVVTADRRKLLEFLLSSFEIAVSRSGEIIRISRQNDMLSSSLAATDARLQDLEHTIESLGHTITQNEQLIAGLSADLAERDRSIQKSADEIHRLETELGIRDTRLVSFEEQACGLNSQLTELTAKYTFETTDLKQQVTSLTGCLTSTHSDLDAVRESLTAETARRVKTESRLQESETECNTAEESLQARTLECEQVRSALLSEKIRAESAEHEAKTLLQAKNESEEDLTCIIRGFKDTVQKRDEDILHFKEALTARDARIAVLENRAAELESEKIYAHAEMQARADSAAASLCSLNTRIDELNAMLATKEQEIVSRDTLLHQMEDTRDQAARDLQLLSENLNTARSRLAEAEDQHLDAVAQLNADIEKRDALLNELRSDLLTVQNERESYLNSLEKARCDLDTAITVRTDLEASLENADVRIRNLNSDLQAATASTTGASQEVQRLSGELAEVRSELENAHLRHHKIEESLHTEQGEKEQVSRDLQDLSRQRDALVRDLDEARRTHAELVTEHARLVQEMETDTRNLLVTAAAQDERIATLTSELAHARSVCQNLELQVSVLAREKQQTEEHVKSLSIEIDQARTALADEWESHMDDQEKLVAVTSDNQMAMSASLYPTELESEKAKKRALLIVKGPDLPVALSKQMHAMSVFPSPPPVELPVPRITNVEDLFEDEMPQESEALPEESAPSVSIIHEHSYEESEEKASSEFTAVPDSISVAPVDEPGDSDDEFMQDRLGKNAPASQVQNNGPGSHVPLSFNRAQWFDLLKWSHHVGTLSQEQRMQIVRMGRLIQQGRKLTPRQEEQVLEMILLAQAQGFTLQ